MYSEIRTSENGKTLKSGHFLCPKMTVFGRLFGIFLGTQSDRIGQKTKWCMLYDSKSPKRPSLVVQILDIWVYMMSGNGTKVECPKFELVQVSDVHCNFKLWLVKNYVDKKHITNCHCHFYFAWKILATYKNLATYKQFDQ